MSLTSRDKVSKEFVAEHAHRFGLILETREIFLHGYIEDSEEDPGIEFRSATNFLKNLKILESAGDAPIIIHQYSLGGGWLEGMIIYDAIQTCKCPVLVITYGAAFSMGTIVLQSADLRISMPNCWWMFHYGYTGIESSLTSKSAVAWSDWERKITKQMISIYTNACINSEHFADKSEKQVANYLKRLFDSKEDWIISAQEAQYYGFCDGIYGEPGFESIKQITKNMQ